MFLFFFNRRFIYKRFKFRFIRKVIFWYQLFFIYGGDIFLALNPPMVEVDNIFFTSQPQRQLHFHFYLYLSDLHLCKSTGLILTKLKFKKKFFKRSKKALSTIGLFYWRFFRNFFEQPLLFVFLKFTLLQYVFFKILTNTFSLCLVGVIAKKSSNPITKRQKRIKRRVLYLLLKEN